MIRNRVSAQQARERKKQYVTDLELQLHRAEVHTKQALSKVAALERDNATLRRIITTMRPQQPAAGEAETSNPQQMQSPQHPALRSRSPMAADGTPAFIWEPAAVPQAPPAQDPFLRF